MTSRRISVLIGTAVAVAGLAAATAITACGTSAPPSASKAAAPSPSASAYSWYQSMMNRYYGGSTMMGGTGGSDG
jgi:hypothetical protein